MPHNCKTVATISSHKQGNLQPWRGSSPVQCKHLLFLSREKILLRQPCLSEDLMKSVNQKLNISISCLEQWTELSVVMLQPRLLAGYFSSLSYSLVSSAQIWSLEGFRR